jgi:copper resistance protein B
MSRRQLHLRRTVLRIALLGACAVFPCMAAAQTAPAPASSAHSKDMGAMDMGSMDMSAMPGMDHGDMSGMAMPASSSTTAKPVAAPVKAKGMKSMPGMHHKHAHGMAMPASSTSAAKPAAASSGDDMGSMPGMQHEGMSGMDHDSMAGMEHGAMPAMHHGTPVPAANDHASMAGMPMGSAMAPMTMGAMQGGSAPPGARSPDYSDGIGYGSMAGMDMSDSAAQSMLLVDKLEAVHGRNAHGQSWDAEGWYGGDIDKLWLRSEGERSAGRLEDGSAEALWYHTLSTYWGSQLGVRHDLGEGPSRSWAAYGIEGLAPYWFELQATAYVGAAGRTAARLQADYDLRFTQRLVLQPELELNAYGKSDPARRIGRGISDVSFGLRLRYEITRQFAPYLGVNWIRRTGISAGYARDDHQPVLDRQIVAGLRLWF